MGEAARRKAEIQALKNRRGTWLDSLNDEERTVVKVAGDLYDKFVNRYNFTEGCYLLSFFLREYLRREHSIHVDVVVGWVNDGTWDGASSHAWVEFCGRKVDISLHKTSHPDVQPPGDLILLDYVEKKGLASYSYWKELQAQHATTLTEMRKSDSEFDRVVARKDAEHQRMCDFAAMTDGAAKYLSSAPRQLNYDALAKMLA
ncbi:Rho GTPase-activating protein [Paraburkholderia tropica]|uniref:Uncharacterized protein n=1 Tax=Paraburkholderia tropica TaxID=92647 RepID=A0AAQ1GL99_9BURK|nr:hypothetical protein [Paraburkholderia tropica]RQN40792.1 hypothetical protein EHZ25_00585 [Paraburkholderia tropica]SEK09310.1 hypothetical protein SAMN05216550_117171 [Paraburkholderia tropica]